MQSYLCDETVVTVRPKPAENVVVVKPANSQEISEILKLANQEKTPVFIRGGGTGLCGGAIPTKDGLLISMERLNKVVEMDVDNLMITVESRRNPGGYSQGGGQCRAVLSPPSR